MTLLAAQFVDGNHEGGNGGVIREFLDIVSYLLDELMQRFQ